MFQVTLTKLLRTQWKFNYTFIISDLWETYRKKNQVGLKKYHWIAAK